MLPSLMPTMTDAMSEPSTTNLKTPAFPPPSTPPIQPTVQARPFFTFHEPPPHLLAVLPNLPQPRTYFPQNELHRQFWLTTHLVPAAYPRSTPLVEPETVLSQDPLPEGKAERIKRGNEVTFALNELKDRYWNGELAADASTERLLWNTVDRYIRKRGLGPHHALDKKAVTVLILHATGSNRESAEPFLSHLVSKTDSDCSGVYIDEILSFEAVNHGDSAIINAGKLGVLYDWRDSDRDLLNFLVHYLPPKFAEPNHPHLKRQPDSLSHHRLINGLTDRTFIAIGSSFGGTTVACSATNMPSLFSSVILVDPVIFPDKRRKDYEKKLLIMTSSSFLRRETWASKAEAKASLKKSRFFSNWDPEALELYTECAVIEDGNGARLKMPSLQEAVTYSEWYHQRECYAQLPNLPDRVGLHWIYQGKDDLLVGDEDYVSHVVWRRPTNSTNSRISGSGHLVVQEAPEGLATEISEFLDKKYGFHAFMSSKL